MPNTEIFHSGMFPKFGKELINSNNLTNGRFLLLLRESRNIS